MCRSFNFSVVLGADSRGRLKIPFRRIPEGLARRSTVTLYLFCQHFILELLRRVLPFFDLKLRAEPSSSFDKSAPLEARQLFLGASTLERDRRCRFSSCLSIPISGVLFAARWRRHRLSFCIFLAGQTRTTVGKGYCCRTYELSFDDPSASLNLRLRHCTR